MIDDTSVSLNIKRENSLQHDIQHKYSTSICNIKEDQIVRSRKTFSQLIMSFYLIAKIL